MKKAINFNTMEKDFFRLTEEAGSNSEYYSDDDVAGNLQDQIREEYKSIPSNGSASPIELNGAEKVKESSSYSDDEYNELFNSI